MHLPVLIEQDEDNVYIISCPVFKGGHSYGKTVDDALVNIREVIDMCMDEEWFGKKFGYLVQRRF